MTKYYLSLGAFLIVPFISFASYGGSAQTATFVGTTATTTPSGVTGITQETKTTPPRAEPTKTETAPSVTTKPEEPEEASTDYLLKLGGVDGESKEEAKKGNVEFEWKVEEGESAAASDMYIKFDGIDGEAEAAGGVRVAVGDIDGDGRTEITEGMVDGVVVRGWDPDKKNKILGKAPASGDAVKDEAGLALFIAKTADGDAQMEQISFNFEKISLKYNSEGKLFGLITMELPMTVDLMIDETGESAVSVKFPWYAFFMSKAVSGNDIVDGVDEAEESQKGKDHKNEIEILSYSFGASSMGTAFSTLSNVLKTKHEVAKNSIGNVR